MYVYDGKYTLRKILLLMYFMTNETPIQINKKLLNKFFRTICAENMQMKQIQQYMIDRSLDQKFFYLCTQCMTNFTSTIIYQ